MRSRFVHIPVGTSRRATVTGPRIILLESADDNLAVQFQGFLAPGELLLRVHDASTHELQETSDLLVLDRRDSAPVLLPRDVPSIGALASRVACVVLSSPSLGNNGETLCRLSDESRVLFLPESPFAALLVRAYMNAGRLRHWAVAATQMLIRVLGPPLVPILNASIASGFAVSSVKELARLVHRDRGTVRRSLRSRSTGLTPKLVIDLAKATYGLLLLRGAEQSLRSVALALGFRCSKSVPALLQRTFGLSDVEVRNQSSGPDAVTFAYSAIEAWRRRQLVIRESTSPDDAAHDETSGLRCRSIVQSRSHRKAGEWRRAVTAPG